MSGKIPGHVLDIFRKFPGNVREHVRIFPGHVLAISWNFPGNVLDMAWKFPGFVWENSRICPGNYSVFLFFPYSFAAKSVCILLFPLLCKPFRRFFVRRLSYTVGNFRSTVVQAPRCKSSQWRQRVLRYTLLVKLSIQSYIKILRIRSLRSCLLFE